MSLPTLEVLPPSAREVGFEIGAIRALVKLQDDPDQSCASAGVIAVARLLEVEQRIRSCRPSLSCGYGSVGQCRVIELLVEAVQREHR